MVSEPPMSDVMVSMRRRFVAVGDKFYVVVDNAITFSLGFFSCCLWLLVSTDICSSLWIWCVAGCSTAGLFCWFVRENWRHFCSFQKSQLNCDVYRCTLIFKISARINADNWPVTINAQLLGLTRVDAKNANSIQNLASFHLDKSVVK